MLEFLGIIGFFVLFILIGGIILGLISAWIDSSTRGTNKDIEKWEKRNKWNRKKKSKRQNAGRKKKIEFEDIEKLAKLRNPYSQTQENLLDDETIQRLKEGLSKKQETGGVYVYDFTEKFEKNKALIFINGNNYIPYICEPRPMTGEALESLIKFASLSFNDICNNAMKKRESNYKGKLVLGKVIYDWEGIKEYVKGFDNKTHSKRNSFGMMLEAICFNIFEFGRLSSKMRLSLGMFYMGMIDENKLDEDFEVEYVNGNLKKEKERVNSI